MKKEDRMWTDEMYVSSFVPIYQLLKKQPDVYHPYLEALLTELEELSIIGNIKM